MCSFHCLPGFSRPSSRSMNSNIVCTVPGGRPISARRKFTRSVTGSRSTSRSPPRSAAVHFRKPTRATAHLFSRPRASPFPVPHNQREESCNSANQNCFSSRCPALAASQPAIFLPPRAAFCPTCDRNRQPPTCSKGLRSPGMMVGYSCATSIAEHFPIPFASERGLSVLEHGLTLLAIRFVRWKLIR
jgi:hypothetical protein